MGQANSGASNLERFKRDFQEVQVQYDQFFGEVTILRHIHNQEVQVMAKQIIFDIEDNFRNFKAIIESRKMCHGENSAKFLTVLGN